VTVGDDSIAAEIFDVTAMRSSLRTSDSRPDGAGEPTVCGAKKSPLSRTSRLISTRG